MICFYLILGFVVSLLTVFTFCLVVARQIAQAKEDLKQWKIMSKTQRKVATDLAAAKSDLAWRGNKEMVMY